MIDIPLKYFKNETIHRNMGTDVNNGILSCGFLHKKSRTNSDTNVVFDYYGALILLSGEGVHLDNNGHDYKLYPGAFIQRIPGKLHSTYVHPDGKWLEFFICFGRGIYEALADINVLNNREDVLYPGLNMAIFDECVKFMNLLKSASQEELPLLLNEAQRIILTINQMHINNLARVGEPDLIKQACRMIIQNPANSMGAREISRELGVGYEKFRKLFKANMGISPGKYQILERINTAKSMLLDTNKSIKHIALELGFSDSFSFTKQFKKMMGVSPTEYRRKQ